MSEEIKKRTKKEVIKDIILKLHKGLSVREAKEELEKEVGKISSTEIAEIEQSLINEGLSPEEIKKFCNVHALMFKETLEESITKETSPAHPVHLFKLENREVEKITKGIRELFEKRDGKSLERLKEELREMLLRLKEVEKHYERKEQLLFPFLEKQGFFGPSKVMWGKDNEIRDLLRNSLSKVDLIRNEEQFDEYQKSLLNPLLEEIEGMIFKEENILFPTSLEKLKTSDWVEILKESDEIGYVYIEKPKETEALIRELKEALLEVPEIEEEKVLFPTGSLSPEELMHMLNTLPVDYTFVDREDLVRYFSAGKERIFVRTKSVLGRKVQNCHPPQSVHVVEKILQSFKNGRREPYEFWISFRGRMIYIRYFPVRDREGAYLGTLEVTQDVTEIQKLKGEKRLLDESY